MEEELDWVSCLKEPKAEGQLKYKIRVRGGGSSEWNQSQSFPFHWGQIWLWGAGGTRDERTINSGCYKPGGGWEVGNKGLCFFKKQSD